MGFVEKKLSASAKRDIRKVIESNFALGPPADLELTYTYIVSLLENQHDSFWEEDNG